MIEKSNYLFAICCFAKHLRFEDFLKSMYNSSKTFILETGSHLKLTFICAGTFNMMQVFKIPELLSWNLAGMMAKQLLFEN